MGLRTAMTPAPVTSHPRRPGRPLLAAAGLIALLVAAVATAGGSPTRPETAAAAAGSQTRPNVVVVMTDDQTMASLRYMPNVKRLLVNKGTTFRRNYSTFPSCCPSRSTFLTGQYPHNHRVLGNNAPIGGFGKLHHPNTLPVWLEDAGYRTIHVGRYLNQYGYRNPYHIPPGWTEWHTTVGASAYRYWDYTMNENGVLRRYGENRQSSLYQTDFYTRRARRLIRRFAPSRTPFFLSIDYLAPHSRRAEDTDDRDALLMPDPAPRHLGQFSGTPLPRPPSFNEGSVSDKPRDIRERPPLTEAKVDAVARNYRQRLESLQAVDQGVRWILSTLKGTGELRKTLFVFTSDNGFFHGEHRVPSGKVLLYEPSVRVPLVMRGPGVPRGRRVNQLTGNVDLAPTILDATGAAPHRAQDGLSLFSLMADPGLRPGRELVLERGPAPGGARYSAVRSERYVYAEYQTGERELYDLRRDPFQRRSRHSDPAYASIRRQLASRLQRLRGCRGRACLAGPRLRLRVAGRSPMGQRGCVVGLRARVSGLDSRKVVRVDFLVNGRRRARDRSLPFRRRLGSRAIPRGRFTLRALAVLKDSRRLTLDESRFRGCR